MPPACAAIAGTEAGSPVGIGRWRQAWAALWPIPDMTVMAADVSQILDMPPRLSTADFAVHNSGNRPVGRTGSARLDAVTAPPYRTAAAADRRRPGRRRRHSDEVPGLPKVLHGFAGRSMLGHALAAVAPLRPRHHRRGHRPPSRRGRRAHLTDIAPDAVPVVQDSRTAPATPSEPRWTSCRRRAGHRHRAGAAGRHAAADRQHAGRAAGEHTATGAAATVLTSVAGRSDRLRPGDPDGDRPSACARSSSTRTPTRPNCRSPRCPPWCTPSTPGGSATRCGRLPPTTPRARSTCPTSSASSSPRAARCTARVAPAVETAGVNDRVQLAAAHRSYNDRLLEEHMRAGVTVIDPATTWVDADVVLEPDVTLPPERAAARRTRIGAGATIGPDCTLTDTVVGAGSMLHRTVANQARVGAGVTVGPFAYLRPGTDLADQVHIGTFVEIKACRRRRRDQGAASELRRRRHHRRAHQHRRGHRLRQLRRGEQAPLDDRQPRPDRCRQHVRGAGARRRRRLHRGRIGHRQ